jgi:hypothetical protein
MEGLCKAASINYQTKEAGAMLPRLLAWSLGGLDYAMASPP